MSSIATPQFTPSASTNPSRSALVAEEPTYKPETISAETPSILDDPLAALADMTAEHPFLPLVASERLNPQKPLVSHIMDLVALDKISMTRFCAWCSAAGLDTTVYKSHRALDAYFFLLTCDLKHHPGSFHCNFCSLYIQVGKDYQPLLDGNIAALKSQKKFAKLKALLDEHINDCFQMFCAKLESTSTLAPDIAVTNDNPDVEDVWDCSGEVSPSRQLDLHLPLPDTTQYSAIFLLSLCMLIISK